MAALSIKDAVEGVPGMTEAKPSAMLLLLANEGFEADEDARGSFRKLDLADFPGLNAQEKGVIRAAKEVVELRCSEERRGAAAQSVAVEQHQGPSVVGFKRLWSTAFDLVGSLLSWRPDWVQEVAPDVVLQFWSALKRAKVTSEGKVIELVEDTSFLGVDKFGKVLMVRDCFQKLELKIEADFGWRDRQCHSWNSRHRQEHVRVLPTL